ncbi:MAG: TetR/AcrR family transcriptional regulator [Acidimicrobiia bacterium]
MNRARGAEVVLDRREQENGVLSISAWAAEQAASTRERRLLMQAAIDVMCEQPDKSPRVSDIVGRAGLSNNAFYRHFRGKDDLVLAILDDGRRTLLGYLDHLMGGEATGQSKVRRWIEGMMAQAVDHDAAARTRAVHVNAARVDGGVGDKGRRAEADLRALLQTALRQAGSADPALDAYVIWQAVVGSMTDFLVRQVEPSVEDIGHLASFCVAGLGVAHGT